MRTSTVILLIASVRVSRTKFWDPKIHTLNSQSAVAAHLGQKDSSLPILARGHSFPGHLRLAGLVRIVGTERSTPLHISRFGSRPPPSIERRPPPHLTIIKALPIYGYRTLFYSGDYSVPMRFFTLTRLPAVSRWIGSDTSPQLEGAELIGVFWGDCPMPLSLDSSPLHAGGVSSSILSFSDREAS